MTAHVGRRERKKQRTREAIAEAATRLMIAQGFADVSIAQIAEAADVSVMTVYNYFPTKEDLILGQIEDHTRNLADAVRSRQAGVVPLVALRDHFLERIEAADPITGLSDDPSVLAFGRLVLNTPSLRLRLVEQQEHAAQHLAAALAEALGQASDDATSVLAAVQVVAVQQSLTSRNLKRVLHGRDPEQVHRLARTEAMAAYRQLESGLGSIGWLGADPGTSTESPVSESTNDSP